MEEVHVSRSELDIVRMLISKIKEQKAHWNEPAFDAAVDALERLEKEIKTQLRTRLL